mmetsp:Transcript_35150/g.76961  ORF Transcript_35150/g.76961 Transcript_35150/m.76961 type:complete len:249 (+) Transcript_35150:88-834(+)
MAAVICKALSEICDGACDALGAVICLPCKACGFACTELSSFCKSPFCLYLAVALGLNLPPVVFAAKLIGTSFGGDSGCGSASSWLNVNALLCLINMAAALYICGKISHEPDIIASETVNAAPYIEASVFNSEAKTKTASSAPIQEATVVSPTKKTLGRSIMESTPTSDTRSKSFARVKDILCYDPIVAIYIIIGVFYLIWNTIGVGRSGGALGCGEGLANSVSNALMCNFLFITLGGMAFACSVCCLR